MSGWSNWDRQSTWYDSDSGNRGYSNYHGYGKGGDFHGRDYYSDKDKGKGWGKGPNPNFGKGIVINVGDSIAQAAASAANQALAAQGLPPGALAGGPLPLGGGLPPQQAAMATSPMAAATGPGAYPGWPQASSSAGILAYAHPSLAVASVPGGAFAGGLPAGCGQPPSAHLQQPVPGTPPRQPGAGQRRGHSSPPTAGSGGGSGGNKNKVDDSERKRLRIDLETALMRQRTLERLLDAQGSTGGRPLEVPPLPGLAGGPPSATAPTQVYPAAGACGAAAPVMPLTQQALWAHQAALPTQPYAPSQGSVSTVPVMMHGTAADRPVACAAVAGALDSSRWDFTVPWGTSVRESRARARDVKAAIVSAARAELEEEPETMDSSEEGPADPFVKKDHLLDLSRPPDDMAKSLIRVLLSKGNKLGSNVGWPGIKKRLMIEGESGLVRMLNATGQASHLGTLEDKVIQMCQWAQHTSDVESGKTAAAKKSATKKKSSGASSARG